MEVTMVDNKVEINLYDWVTYQSGVSVWWNPSDLCIIMGVQIMTLCWESEVCIMCTSYSVKEYNQGLGAGTCDEKQMDERLNCEGQRDGGKCLWHIDWHNRAHSDITARSSCILMRGLKLFIAILGRADCTNCWVCFTAGCLWPLVGLITTPRDDDEMYNSRLLTRSHV